MQRPAGGFSQIASPYIDGLSDQYVAPPQEQRQDLGDYGQQQPSMESQMAALNMGGETQPAARGHKKKDRHAYHNLNTSHATTTAPFQGLPQAAPVTTDQFGIGPHYGQGVPQEWSQHLTHYQPVGAGGAPFVQPIQQQQRRPQAYLEGTPASSTQGRIDPEQVPSIPLSRDAPAEAYLTHVYPTMEQHLPPPAAIPFVAVDQGNTSPKFARLTLNNIPTSAEALATTALPLGLILQPLCRVQDGELPIPVIDFGEIGPPRCRRCRAYINPFMIFRSGGKYFAPTDPSGVRVDRMQRPELTLGTVEYTVPREYWAKEPVPLRWLFLIDASMEAVSKGFLHGFCQGVLYTLYGESMPSDAQNGELNGSKPGNLPAGCRVGIATFDREVQFYNLSASLDQAQMVVMPDMEDPFVPLSDGLFVEPESSRSVITALLTQIPNMFTRVKTPEPALLPTLTAALDALKTTGGKIVCSLSSLPTWGPGALMLREKQEMRDTDQEKKLFTTEQPGFTKVARQMTENGIGIDFFMAAPQGGYLDIATIGHVSEKTGGEVYYYPNFYSPRDTLRLSKEIKHTVTRETGFQALMKVRCSNGLQISGYSGNFTQHTFGADLEFGVIDCDKTIAVAFSYDGKLDAKLDAHFQSALLYTTVNGERRVRCTNTVASVSESAMESMKFVDQDAVLGMLSKQAASRMPERPLKDIRAGLTEKTIDILAAYRKNFSGSHPPGQLVLPENLKEFSMYMLGLIKSRALKAGHEPTDRRVYDMRLLKSMGLMELSLYLYPRVIAIHNLDEQDGFPNENGHLRMPPSIRASYSRVEEGGAYIVDCGQVCLLWLHAHVSPNLLEDLFGEGKADLQSLDATSSSLPVLQTHLNAQVRNILQYLEDTRGSKALTIQLARQGLDGAEFEFARLLFEDRNNEAQSYVDWLVHLHRHIQLELQGHRKKEESSGNGALAGLTGLKAPYWSAMSSS